MIAWLLLQAMRGAVVVQDAVFVTLEASREERALFRECRKMGQPMTWHEKAAYVALARASTPDNVKPVLHDIVKRAERSS